MVSADLVAFYVPMHTATRIAASIIRRVRQINPRAHLCCYGLYAPVNELFLRSLGVATVLGGEFEQGLVSLYRRLVEQRLIAPVVDQVEPRVSLAKQTFITPDRSSLLPLSRYAWLERGDGSRRIVGYTEASRGCKHQCRHCPIVPVYNGRFRIVQRDVVLADIRQQVAAGAQHITFGDPDFLNGPGHALPLVQALHREFPNLTYDVTIKIEHLLRHADTLPILHDTGCLFVTSAVEAVDDRILAIFDKRHTVADFIRVVGLCREIELTLSPTFVTFTPWTTREGYRAFLQTIDELDLIDNIAPIQYAIRLLIPAGSKLLELPDAQRLIGPFDQAALSYPWAHPDPDIDQLYRDVLRTIKQSQAQGEARATIFERVRALAGGRQYERRRRARSPHAPIPYLSEPWFC